VERITGKKPALVQGDIRDSAALVAALRQSRATAVVHFAGLKRWASPCNSRWPITTTTW